jgi:hypothetical protein
VTIGIGYDLAHQGPATIRRDWAGLLPDTDIERLAAVSGLAGARARAALPRVASVVVPFAVARKVFYLRSLPAYAVTTRGAYPGVEALPADAQAALLSLVYNVAPESRASGDARWRRSVHSSRRTISPGSPCRSAR